MPNIITEGQIQEAAIGVFTNNLGYRHIYAEHNDTTGRTSQQEVVLLPVLRAQLIRLNPHLPGTAIEEAIARLTDSRMFTNAVEANRELYHLMRDGVQVTITNAKGRQEPATVKVIDFDDETQNDYLVVSELWVQGEVYRRRADLVVFLNGLPLIFIELKNSNEKLRIAYDKNLLDYRKDIMQLFHYNALCLLSNGIETKAGAFSAGWDHFFLWQRVQEEDERPDKERIRQYGVSLDYAILGICEKKRLLDYFENFIFYYNDTVKICAKNHQLLGVNNLIRRFKERRAHDAEGTDEQNKGKLGVFWHTQGSGKSYSMIFFTRKVFRKFTGNYTFLIVTDRDDLDGQIYRNFLRSDTIKSGIKHRPRNSEQLREMLQTNTRYIFTLIHKFRYDKGKKYPVLSTRNNIVVIVDEAHRTQYKDLAENMRTGLPHAQYVAFTGTPLLGSRKLTNDWFGDTVSEYNFKQSVEDEATRPLFYHKRVPEVLLQNDTLDDDFAEIVSDDNLTEEEEQRLIKEHAQEMSVLKRDDRLETIARDIVYHFPRRGYLGKGMVISVDKFTAVKMYDKVKRLWEEEKRNIQKKIGKTVNGEEREELRYILDWMRKVDMAVVVSEEAGEEEKFAKEQLDIKPHRERIKDVDENGLELEDKFKEPEDPLQLVFVCSMWLTGFDAPTVSTLYLDKPMKDHTLMQTIARANRVTSHVINGKTKRDGLIVDYYNVFRNLKKAFASYGGGDIEEKKKEEVPVQEREQLFVLLKDAIEECKNWCAGIKVDLDKLVAEEETFGKIKLFDEYADVILSNDEHKQHFIVFDNTIDSLYESCRPEILQRRDEFILKKAIRYLRKVLDGKVNRKDLGDTSRKISRLLDESIVTDENYEGAIREGEHKYGIKAWRKIDLSKLDTQKLREEYKTAEYKHIEVNDLRAFIEDKMHQLLNKNVTRKGFAEKLNEIINRYNSGGAIVEDYFNDLMDFVDKLREEEERHIKEGLTESELEIYDLLKKEKLTKKEKQQVKLAAQNLLKRLNEEKPYVLVQDWYKYSQTREQVRGAISKVLDKDLPESYDRVAFNEKVKEIYEHLHTSAAGGYGSMSA